MNKQSDVPDKKPSLPVILGQAPPLALLDLPTEILIIILRNLPVPDVMRVRFTCRLLDSVICTVAALQYNIELYCAWRCDMAGAPSFLTTALRSSEATPLAPETHSPFQASTPLGSSISSTPYSTRLDTLRALERNWRHLSFPAPSRRFHVPFRTTYVYELSGGYFILGSDRTTRPPGHAAGGNETGDGWVSMDIMNKTMELNLLPLPRLLRDTDPKESKGKDRAQGRPDALAWVHLPLPFPIADFGIDASQDLLVLMQRHRLGHGFSFRFHLYTLECTPHPQASVTTLSAPPPKISLHPTSLSWDWAIVHISGSILVVLLCSQRGPGSVLVWDWRKGIPLVEDSTPEFVQVHDISLIAPNILAAACTEHGCIDILTFSTSQDSETAAAPEQLKLRLLHRLVLPSQEPGTSWTYGDINARLHPPPSSSILHRSKCSSPHPGSAILPFETDPEDGIVVYSMRLLNTQTGGSDFTLVTHRSALINPRGWSEVELSRVLEDAKERPFWSDMRSGERVGVGRLVEEIFGSPKIQVPWKEWGPKHTRWIDGVRSTRWICWVHGHRLAEIEEWEPPRRPLRRGLAQLDVIDESSLAEQRAKRVITKAIRAFKDKETHEASPSTDGVSTTSLTGTVTRGEVVDLEEDEWEDVEDDSWDAYIEPNISPFLDTMIEEDQAELLEALRKVYECPPANPALYLRVWDFNPRTVRRALGEGTEWSLPVVSDTHPTPDVAVTRGPVVVVERGGKPVEDEPGTCLPYILSTVKLDVPVDRSKKRGVVLDGEHIILVQDAQTNNDTEATELVEVFSL